ncbi:MAG: D-alanyl-D-alanine carboxypeptidase [Rhizobium sp.]|nr:D-alanyl-D-alanine carboxypeptidase [Rhizobium sp.]
MLNKDITADISAKAAVVMDVNSNRVLLSKNSNIRLPMASTTKIMTALVAIESGNLNESVKVSHNAAFMDGSSIYLKEGESIKLEELLYGLMMHSGNDAAVAIAEHIGGSISGFAERMNAKAMEIGAYNTHFDNPHGLDSSSHYTTAYDLALITSYALKNPKFAEIVRTKRKTIAGPDDESWNRVLTNKNKMLWNFNGGDGVKTGYTRRAGRCLVSSASRNNWQLVSVVLNCGPMWADSSTILNQCFNQYNNYSIIQTNKSNTYKEVLVKGGKKMFVSVRPSQNYTLPLTQDELSQVTITPVIKSPALAPIKKGTKAGDLNIYLGRARIGTVALEFCEDIQTSNPIYYIRKAILGF